MIKSYGFWCLQYDDSNLGDEDYCTFKLEKELYYDHSKKLWVKRNEYTGSWYPADFPCRSLKAAKRHLRKHNEIPKGTKFRLVSGYIGFDLYLTKR